MQKEERNIVITVMILAIIIIVVALIGEFTLGKDNGTIQGQAEVQEYRVSSKVPARVLKYFVREGDKVNAGDTVVILEAPDVTAKLVQAEAVKKAAQALNEQVVQGTRPEQKRAAYEMWQKAVAGMDIAQKSFARVQKLYEEGVTTAQKRDEAEAAMNAALATERAAKAEYELALKGAQVEEKEITAAKIEQAQGAVEEVDSYIEETVLTAIRDGEISDIFPAVGELVGSGAPIMNIAYLDEMWFSFNIREDDLKEYNIGDTTNTYIPALDKHIDAEIYYMKDLGTYAVWRATKATGEYDIKTFEVRARPIEAAEGVRPGMSVLIKRR